ncbi:MAG: MBL fold metallo-hydrolase [Hyphomonadaceae bacterium]|nr:MBL fold metallo-hydrolase [Hyphomonadaceae bacterium]
MKDWLDRREVVRLAGAAGLAAGLTGLAGCAGGPEVDGFKLPPGKTAGEFEATELAPGVKLISGAGSNVLAVAGPEGAVMIDGGLVQHASGLIQRVQAETGSRKVARLINTHWHPEATGANDLLGAKGTPILAHENTRLWMGTEITSGWQDKVYPPRQAKARPTETFYTTRDIALGAEILQCGYLLQAHTDGDIYVRLAKANVIAAGGVLSGNSWPIIDWQTGGWIGAAASRSGPTFNNVEVPTYGGMVGALQTLASLADDNTRIVPADGPVLTKADVETQIVMYAAIAARLRDMMNKGLGTDEVLAAAATREFDARMGDPELFLTLAFESLWGHVTPDA